MPARDGAHDVGEFWEAVQQKEAGSPLFPSLKNMHPQPIVVLDKARANAFRERDRRQVTHDASGASEDAAFM